MNPTTSHAKPCLFPANAWYPEFVGQSSTPTPNLPHDWAAAVKLAGPIWDDTESECTELSRAMALRVARLNEIRTQAASRMDAVWPVQKLVGSTDNPLKLATKAMVSALLDNINAPIFHFKEAFIRGRPYHCCRQSLDPMFSWGDPLHPGHPSYPSGHSTQVHALAALYAHMFPGLEQPLLLAADRIAKNREIAGLHYPSDSHAGKLLAVQLVDLLLKNGEFQVLVKKAQKEWP